MSAWKREPPAEPVRINVDGETVVANRGDSVALALLAAGHEGFAAPSGSPTPYCLMGVCFGCLCTINGRPGEQACLYPVREGLDVSLRQDR